MSTNQPKIAIIQFPGTNCEYETKRAINASDMQGEFFRWNDDYEKLKQFDGYIIPGGFSYQDRSRAGIIASLDPLMNIVKQEAKKGKPVLGICNGAQILMESGMVPGLENYKLGGAIAINKRVQDDKVLGTGFYNTWIRTASEDNVFGQKLQTIKMPIAHGEGRFIFEPELLEQMINKKQISFRYCDENGQIVDKFPINPNGSIHNIAGVSNEQGNVIAMMPHPERCESGLSVFKSMKHFIGGLQITPLIAEAKEVITDEKPIDSLEIFVKLIITDNEAITVENTLHQLGFENTQINRLGHWKIKLNNPILPITHERDLEKIIREIILSNELLNTSKEIPYIKINNQWFSFTVEGGLKVGEYTNDETLTSYLVNYKEDCTGQSKLSTLKKFGVEGIEKITKGIIWKVKDNKDNLENILQTNIFHNPFSQVCEQISL